MVRSAKVLERMVNLNTFDEIAQDFRFWEDACDEYKENEGTAGYFRIKAVIFMFNVVRVLLVYNSLYSLSLTVFDTRYS